MSKYFKMASYIALLHIIELIYITGVLTYIMDMITARDTTTNFIGASILIISLFLNVFIVIKILQVSGFIEEIKRRRSKSQ